jgi:hypothetical protein
MWSSLFILAVFQACATQLSVSNTLISETGIYHGDEWNGEAGDHWLGLYAAETGLELRKTAVTVERVEDPIVDGSGEKSGKEVAAEGDDTPLFLFQGIAELVEGGVLNAYSGQHFVEPDESFVLRLGSISNHERQYWLKAKGKKVDDYSLTDYSLTLVQHQADGSQKTQVLAQFDTESNEAHPHLLWAGDLDRDGKLDLIANLTWHYNVSHLVLFLSSHAKPGALVGVAAELVTSGC